MRLKVWRISSPLLLFMATLLLFPRSCLSTVITDTLSTNQTLVPGETLVSKQGRFELGFFSPGNNTDLLYVGIWYRNIPKQTVVWVGNRDNPILNSSHTSTMLKISDDGSLTLISFFNNSSVWVIKIGNSSSSGVIITSAVILDNGNFVLRNNASETVWQSFDYPTDNWLLGARIGFGPFSAGESKLVSWKSPDDPSTGNFSFGIMSGYGRDELVIKHTASSALTWRSGILHAGNNFAYPSGQALFNLSRVARAEDNSVYLTFNVVTSENFPEARIGMRFDGVLAFYLWSTQSQRWVIYFWQPSDQCSTYATCGANAICTIENNERPCGCLAGFSPKDERSWSSLDFSNGCVRTTPLYCIEADRYGYLRVSDVKLPENPESMEVRNDRMCQFSCSDNCTCQAYAYDSQGSCLLFMGDIVDMNRVTNGSTGFAGSELFIKVNAAAATSEKGEIITLFRTIIIPSTMALAAILSVVRLCSMARKSRNKASGGEEYQDLLLLDLNSNKSENGKASANKKEREKNRYELPIFSFSSVAMATNNFSVENKLGEGGFGPVYKGELQNGQFVAIKRLSRKSGQGLEEFKTEIELIAKLQHRNLVGILGCCIENDEKILIYEYMKNKSLDFFLFDSNRKASLSWTKRLQIIEGVAQGLLYLHHYSRLRIVHRDLKASNILLDEEMNPKISDFGMARIFGGKSDSQANTERIVGTFGYMSPEYIMHGIFSVKSDVYAFGVLMLEIISGRKNTGFYGSEHLSLLGYAWNLWENDSVLELIDSTLLGDRCCSSSDPVTRSRCVQVGLLCVQENSSDRPLISEVVAMLSNEQIELAVPKHPAFTVGRLAASSSEGDRICSVNEITFTSMEVPR